MPRQACATVNWESHPSTMVIQMKVSNCISWVRDESDDDAGESGQDCAAEHSLPMSIYLPLLVVWRPTTTAVHGHWAPRAF